MFLKHFIHDHIFFCLNGQKLFLYPTFTMLKYCAMNCNWVVKMSKSTQL